MRNNTNNVNILLNKK